VLTDESTGETGAHSNIGLTLNPNPNTNPNRNRNRNPNPTNLAYTACASN